MIKGELAQVVERLLNMRDVAGCLHYPGSFNFLVLCGKSHLQLDAANIPVKDGCKLSEHDYPEVRKPILHDIFNPRNESNVSK